MSKTLNEQIDELQEEIIKLRSKVKDLSENVEEKAPTPYSRVGSLRDETKNTPVDPTTGRGRFGGFLPWNDNELKSPPLSRTTKPDIPKKGFNKHGHSEFSGGALDINTLELVEYDMELNSDNEWISSEYNKHCQQFFITEPKIKNVQNSNNETVLKKGFLGLTFNPDTKKWGSDEIDVKKTYLVLRDEQGNLVKDDNNNEMKAPLYNSDPTKTNIVWDSNAKVWRLYAVYAD